MLEDDYVFDYITWGGYICENAILVKDMTYTNLKDEIKTQVNKYLPNVVFKNISILQDKEDENGVYAEIEYTVIKGNYEIDNNIQVRLM